LVCAVQPFADFAWAPCLGCDEGATALRKHPLCNSRAERKRKRHGVSRASFDSIPSRLDRLGILSARRARPASAAGCFATFSSRDARLFTCEFVRGALLVCRAPTLGRDCALGLRIHCGEATWRLATDAARASLVRTAVASISGGTSAASTSASGAPAAFVHSFPLVVGSVWHYRSPCRDIRMLVRSRLSGVHRASGESDEWPRLSE
jgi:hypothetical protein